jgi:hypothetical protein
MNALAVVEYLSSARIRQGLHLRAQIMICLDMGLLFSTLTQVFESGQFYSSWSAKASELAILLANAI